MEHISKNKQGGLFHPLRAITNVCENPTNLKWSCDIPLYLNAEEPDGNVRFKIYDVNISIQKQSILELQVPNECKELMSFTLNTKTFFNEILSLSQIKETSNTIHLHKVTKGVLTNKFVQLCKHTYAQTPSKWNDLKQQLEANPPDLTLEYSSSVGPFVEWPLGVLVVQSIIGMGLQRPEIENYQTTIQLKLHEQQFTLKQNEGTSALPVFNVQSIFLTKNLESTLHIKIFHSRSGKMEVVASIEIPVDRINFKQSEYTIQLSQYSKILQGNIVLNCHYTPIINNQNYKIAQLVIPNQPEPDSWGLIFKRFVENSKGTLPKQFKIYIKINLLKAFIKNLTQNDIIQVGVEVQNQRYFTQQLTANPFGVITLPENEILLQLDPFLGKERMIVFTVVLLTHSPEGQLIVKEALTGYLDYTNYLIPSLIKYQFEVRLSNGQQNIGDNVDFIKMNLEISSQLNIPPTHTLSETPIRLQISFDSFRSLNQSLFEDKLNEFATYFLKISYPEDFISRDFQIIFGRVSLRPPRKGVLLFPNSFRKSYISIPRMDQIVQSLKINALSEKLLNFEKDAMIHVKNLYQLVKFEIYQITNNKVQQPDDWNLEKMKSESVVLYARTVRAIDLVWNIENSGTGNFIALEFQRIKNNEIAQSQNFQASEQTNLGYQPLLDLQDENVLVMQVTETQFSVPVTNLLIPEFKQIPLYEKKGVIIPQLHLSCLVEQIEWIEDITQAKEFFLGASVQIGSSENISTDRLRDQWDYRYAHSGPNQYWEVDRTALILSSKVQNIYELVYNQLVQDSFFTIYQLYLQPREIDSGSVKQLVPEYKYRTLQSPLNLNDLRLQSHEKITINTPILNDMKIKVGNVRSSIRAIFIKRLALQQMLQIRLRTLYVIPLQSKDLQQFSVMIKILQQNPNEIEQLDYLLHCDSDKYRLVNLESLPYAEKRAQMIRKHVESIKKLKSEEENNIVDTPTTFQITEKFSDMNFEQGIYFKEIGHDIDIEDLDNIVYMSVYGPGQVLIARPSFHLKEYQFDYIDEDQLSGVARLESIVTLTESSNLGLKNTSFMIRLSVELGESKTAIEKQIEKSKGSLTINQLVKIKQFAEKFSKVIYIDREFRPAQFRSTLRHQYIGYSQTAVTQQLYDMSKTTLNESTLRELFSLEYKNQIVHFKLPKETVLSVEGSIKISFQLQFILVVQKDEQEIRYVKHLRSTQYQYEEQRGTDEDEIRSTNINLEKPIDFTVKSEYIQDADEVYIIFRYMNKDNELMESKGIIEPKSLRPIFKKIDPQPADYMQGQFVVVLMKPKNYRIFVYIRLAISYFTEDPIGQCEFTFHRIVRIDPDYLLDPHGVHINYKNSPLLERQKLNPIFLSKENGVVNEQNIFSNNKLQLQVSCNHQHNSSTTMNSKGVLENGQFTSMKFFTSHNDDELKFQLFITLGQKQVLEFQEKQENKITKNNLKPDDSQRVLKPLEGILLGESAFPLITSLTSQHRRAFFIQPLHEVYYKPKDDSLAQFYDLVNTKDLYVLGAVKYEPIEWATLALQFIQLKDVKINPEWQGFMIPEEQENGQVILQKNDNAYVEFYMTATLAYSKADGTFTNVSNWSSKVVSSTYGEACSSILVFDLGNQIMSGILEISPQIESIFLQTQLRAEFNKQSVLLGEKFTPLTKFLISGRIGISNMNVIFPLTDTGFLLSEPKILISSVLSHEIPKIAERLLVQKPPVDQQTQYEFDFRRRSYWDILCSILNCGLPAVILRGMEELNEFLLYSRPEEYESNSQSLLMGLIVMIRVFHKDTKFLEQALQAVYEISCTCPSNTISFFKENNLQNLMIEIMFNQLNKLPTYQKELKSNLQLFSPEQIKSLSNEKINITILQPEYFQSDEVILQDLIIYVSKIYQRMMDNVLSEESNQTLDLSQPSDFKNQGKIVLFCINILAAYMQGNIQRTLEMSQFFYLIEDAYQRFDEFVDNLANHFCYLVNNLVSLYGDVDFQNYISEGQVNQKNIDMEEFPKIFVVLVANARIATHTEFNAIIQTCHNIVRFIVNQKQAQIIQSFIGAFYDILFSFLEINIEDKPNLDQHLSIIVDNLVYCNEYPQFKAQLKQVLSKVKLQKIIISIIRDELTRDRKEEEQTRRLQYKFLLKNTIDLIGQLILDFGAEENFDELIQFLKDRFKAIKNSKTKFIIEQFLLAMQNKQIKVEKAQQTKDRIKKEKQQKNPEVDLKTRQQQIATKYMISKLDW